MKHLLNVFNGFAGTLGSISQERVYEIGVRGGFARDSRALAGDAVVVARDISNKTKEVYVQATADSRKKSERR